MKKTTHLDADRFRRDAQKYAEYLATPEGRLRIGLAFANLQEFLPKSKASLCALDVGGGTGALAVRLARIGFNVILLDPSPPMLDLARSAAREAGVAESIDLRLGDAGQIAKLFEAGSFDAILCHNVLEFVDDPGAVLGDVARMMRGPSAILSILVRSRAGEVFKAALQTGDLAAAENGLTAEWGEESLYGGKVRLFSADSLGVLLQEASLATAAQRGVRVLADYLPGQISRSAEYGRIFSLERELGKRQEFAGVARYIQCVAQLAGP